ncbi:MAG TPA: ABC transporter permease [Conexibacter sp.]|jgi:peptide/nickel transport system permease protein|nr:ABC transporter permease [Conexibacter sp.]
MIAYTARRILLTVPTLLGVSVISFMLIHLAPGDPATAILGVLATPQMIEHFRVAFHLNDPLPLQYVNWLGGVVTGDFGFSLVTPVSVTSLLGRQFLPTVLLTGYAVVLAVPIAVATGVASAVRRGKAVDTISRAAWLFGLSMPSFWLGLLLILVFGVELRVLPVGGYVSPAEDPVQCLRSLFLPALTLALPLAAVVSRITRATVLELLDKDFVRTARAKGASQRRILWRHVVPNAVAPTLTTIGLQVGYLLGGAVLVEDVFNIPGLGRLLVFSVGNRDYAVIQGIVLLGALSVIVVQLIVDLVISRFDPRIRLR